MAELTARGEGHRDPVGTADRRQRLFCVEIGPVSAFQDLPVLLLPAEHVGRGREQLQVGRAEPGASGQQPSVLHGLGATPGGRRPHAHFRVPQRPPRRSIMSPARVGAAKAAFTAVALASGVATSSTTSRTSSDGSADLPTASDSRPSFIETKSSSDGPARAYDRLRPKALGSTTSAAARSSAQQADALTRATQAAATGGFALLAALNDRSGNHGTGLPVS